MTRNLCLALIAVFAGFIFGFAIGYKTNEYKIIKSERKENIREETINDDDNTGVRIIVSSDGNEAFISSQKENIAQEPNLGSYLREKYSYKKTTVEKVELAEQVIDLGSFPLMREEAEPNFTLSVTSAEDLNSIQAGLEEWDSLTEDQKKEITLKIESAILDFMFSNFTSLSYEDIELQRESYQIFFKALEMANNKNIKEDTNSTQAADELNKIKEFLKSISDVNRKRDEI